jgi:metal-sulfur cluster biosynthetic enzyme
MEEALKDSILGALEMVIDPELGIDPRILSFNASSISITSQ